MKLLIQIGLLVCVGAPASARAAPHDDVPLADKTARLKPGQYVWDRTAEAGGPVSIVIDLGTQRALLYRNGEPIAVSTISSGRKGRETPTGTFTIVEKQVAHRSRTYDNASMPYMQRLTWKGVSMHAGHLPGYPASHGCIRLPSAFARLLYGVTSVGTAVTIRD